MKQYWTCCNSVLHTTTILYDSGWVAITVCIWVGVSWVTPYLHVTCLSGHKPAAHWVEREEKGEDKPPSDVWGEAGFMCLNGAVTHCPDRTKNFSRCLKTSWKRYPNVRLVTKHYRVRLTAHAPLSFLRYRWLTDTVYNNLNCVVNFWSYLLCFFSLKKIIYKKVTTCVLIF